MTIKSGLQKPNQVCVDELLSRGYLSLSKFAKLADISYPTAYKYYKDKTIVTLKVGGIIRVYEDEIRRFLIGPKSNISLGDPS